MFGPAHPESEELPSVSESACAFLSAMLAALYFCLNVETHTHSCPLSLLPPHPLPRVTVTDSSISLAFDSDDCF